MPDAPHFNEPQHWRDKAEQARVLAEQMSDDPLREMMLRIAEDYEYLATTSALRVSSITKAG